jgi:hypothetical protein
LDLFSVLLNSLNIKMGKNYKSPAKINRSLLRLLEYKKAYLEDCWGSDIEIDDQSKTIVWKASNLLNLTLKKNITIVETRGLYNPTFPLLSFNLKLSKFQNMWQPNLDSFTFFACMHDHIMRNSSKCGSLCSRFSSPYCSELSYLLSINNWPSR